MHGWKIKSIPVRHPYKRLCHISKLDDQIPPHVSSDPPTSTLSQSWHVAHTPSYELPPLVPSSQ
ncbi:hypothetical protein Csa_009878, partial [Cucumis sativus]